jgi:hypothetical protein
MVKDFISKFLSLIRLATVLLNNLEFDCSKTPLFNRTVKIYTLLQYFQAHQSERIGDMWQNVEEKNYYEKYLDKIRQNAL